LTLLSQPKPEWNYEAIEQPSSPEPQAEGKAAKAAKKKRKK
jgi:hypothetical protein